MGRIVSMQSFAGEVTVRVPLDYYRILGLPIQASSEQLKQAHRDRALQLPRREYSEVAIAARKQLLDEAYAVLADADQRQAYDTSFLAKSYELEVDSAEHRATEPDSPISPFDPTIDSYTPSIFIEDHQFVGVLLILLELGEYELVLKLGRPYLSSGNVSLSGGQFGPPEIVRADIVLTVALACLELGREQWQQGQYENAAESLDTGQVLLLQEGLFPSIRGEMQADLYKLRPYRILELLALPEGAQTERYQGLELLQDMLQDRGGIDGNGDDQSGLNVDDFLRFIQQLRSYLTSAEQQALFELEARRPSAVATYLAVYALLARGFAHGQPALIRRAKLMLLRLGARQDVYLEQAICALLLGQTEEASRALERSHEFESLAFIREHSQDSPDLLPGLCLYAERWLQNEVFPHFRDLADRKASLKEYFADEQVQAYLEELPSESETIHQWTPEPSAQTINGRNSHQREMSYRQDTRLTAEYATSAGGEAAYASSTTATLEAASRSSLEGEGVMPTAERVPQSNPDGRMNGGASMSSNGGRVGRSQAATLPERNRTRGVAGLRSPTPSRRGRSGLKLDRLLFMFAIGFLGIGALFFLGSRLTRAASGSAPEVVPLTPAFATVPTKVEPVVTALAPQGPLTEQQAQEVVETWLRTKSAAFGENHEVTKLSDILVDPALSQWQARAEEARRDGWYFVYNHSVQITSVTPSEEDDNVVEVIAAVVETAKLHEDGEIDLERSYDSNLQVRYELLKQGDQWRIQDTSVRD